MKFDKTISAIDNWDNIKDKCFKGGCPKDFDNTFRQGILSEDTNSMQHARLASVLIALHEKVNGDTGMRKHLEDAMRGK